ncbi:hypothetical protein FQN54_009248 [Arachnomyces sp. PD_36]|nr:hypothetical protein FQN54_009248 [Arachnomyces sp. PD_36]
MEANPAMRDRDLDDGNQDDILHALHTDTFDSGVDPSSSFPLLGQAEIDRAGYDSYLRATNDWDTFASCPPTVWEGDYASGSLGDPPHTGSFHPPTQLQSSLQQDGFTCEFQDLWNGLDGSIHSGTGSFDFASIFPYSEASSINDADLGQLAIVNQESSVISNDNIVSSFQDSASGILKRWLENHSDHPYPSNDERASLEEQTGLTSKQLSTWFANARRQRKKSLSGHGSSVRSPIQACLAVPPNPAAENWPSMSPLDRWRHSPPEIEAVSRTAITNIFAGSVASKSSSFDRGDLMPAPDDSQPHVHQGPAPTPSVASSESRVSSSSGSSAHSLNSNDSHGSFGRFYASETPRRRRRRKIHPDRPSSKPNRRQFQCTFCTDTFKSKHDWTRHEKTLHLSLESWICAPFGATFRDSSNDEKCAFCDDSDPSKEHVESHRYDECRDKPPALRTFYRKDHLRQHLRLVHGVGKFIPQMEKWKSEVTNINSRCGFCGHTFHLWSERNNHIAHHFRSGAHIKDWRGCRGLDPAVALAVENAMPPYLIDIESRGPEPFSAARRNRKTTTSENLTTRTGAARDAGSYIEQNQPTPFEYLTARLGQFVRKVQAAGTPLTDEMLQREARCFVFGDDDPWNQTAADHPDWLKLFKEGMGLDSTASVIQPDLRPEMDATIMLQRPGFRLPWSTEEWMPHTTPPMI